VLGAFGWCPNRAAPRHTFGAVPEVATCRARAIGLRFIFAAKSCHSCGGRIRCRRCGAAAAEAWHPTARTKRATAAVWAVGWWHSTGQLLVDTRRRRLRWPAHRSSSPHGSSAHLHRERANFLPLQALYSYVLHGARGTESTGMHAVRLTYVQ
jgi:hypothetical protein